MPPGFRRSDGGIGLEIGRISILSSGAYGLAESAPMTRRSSFGRTIAKVVGLAALCASVAGEARAETLRAHYTVTFVGLPVGAAGFVARFDPSRYRFDLDARLTGLAGLFTSFKGAGSASGRFSGTHMLPSAYATASSNPQGSRTVRMGMAGGAVTGVDISPPIEERSDRVPLRPSDKRGVLDPMSALLMSVAGTAPVVGPAGCNRTVPIFDGYSRFNINLSFVREQSVQVPGYAGPVVVCAARYVPIAGHRNRRAVQALAANRDLQVWLAPLGQTRFVFPFKIFIRSELGETVIEAADFQVDSSGSVGARR